jgi:tetratricopeptide (TPR) repeat protein
MMMWKHYILGSVLASVLAASAFAADGSNIRAQMDMGDYAAAYAQADSGLTADGHALAAEILLSEIMLGRAEKNKKQAKRARKRAEAALELDPAHQNARLQYAIADGFVTRETGDVSAWMKKLPQRTLGIVDSYRADFPDDARGDALLGAWHLAIARKAGNKNAEKWFGANIMDGRSLFLAARAQQPDDIVIGVNYAFSLLALDKDDFPDTEEARQILSDMTVLEPRNHMETVLQIYAKEALTRMDDRDVVEDYVGLFLDGKTPE